MSDYRVYHQIEAYLYGTVGPRFRNGGDIRSHDFFCIILWKANRAKSKEYNRLMTRGRNCGAKTIDDVITSLLRALRTTKTPKDKLDAIMGKDYGFKLPMATTILSVFYPKDFTIYDVRVIEILKRDKITTTNVTLRWNQYQKYVELVTKVGVREHLPPTLRDADQWLWGKSFHDQLRDDLKAGFQKKSKKKKARKKKQK